jgi:hypothetical protein
VNYSSITNNPATKYVLYGVAAAVFLLITAKLVLVTAIVLQLILLIGVAVYLSKRFDAMWSDLEEDVTAALSEIRNDVASLRQEIRELREVRAPAHPRAAARPVAARAQPGPTPVSAIFREWE